MFEIQNYSRAYDLSPFMAASQNNDMINTEQQFNINENTVVHFDSNHTDNFLRNRRHQMAVAHVDGNARRDKNK